MLRPPCRIGDHCLTGRGRRPQGRDRGPKGRGRGPRCRGRGLWGRGRGLRDRGRGPRVEVEVPGVRLEVPRVEVEVPEVEARAAFRQPSSMSSPCRASRRSPTGDGLRRASRLHLQSRITHRIGAPQRLLKTCCEISYVPSRGGIPNSAPKAGDVFSFPSPCPLAWEASPISPPVPGRHPRPHPPW